MGCDEVIALQKGNQMRTLVRKAAGREPARREHGPDPDVAAALARVSVCAVRRDVVARENASSAFALIASGDSPEAQWTWAQIRAAVAQDLAKREAAGC